MAQIAAHTFPSAQDIAALGGDAEDFRLRRSPLSLLSGFFWIGFSSLMVLGIGEISSSIANASSNLSWVQKLPYGYLAVIPVFFSLEVVRRYFDDLYVFSKHTVTRRSGLLSFESSIPSVTYSDVRVITVQQDIIGRIFDYGDIELGTAGAYTYPVLLIGVRHPRALARLIDELRTISVQATQEEASIAKTP